MAYPKEYPKLKFPEHQTLLDAQFVRHYSSRPSFAKTVYAAMEAGEKEANEYIGKFGGFGISSSPDYRRLAKTVNHAYDMVRQRICDAAEAYLLAHNGVIDVWPDAVGTGVHQFVNEDLDTKESFGRGTVIFEFFGDDYVDKLRGLRRKKSDFVYRSAPRGKQRHTGGHPEAFLKHDRLEKKKNEAEKETNGFAELCTLAGTPYFAFGTICVLACMFLGFNDVIDGLFVSLGEMPTDSLPYSALSLLYTVAFLPGILYGWISLLPGKLYWPLTVLLLVLCAGGSVFCLYLYREFHKASVLARQAAKEYREFIKSDEYKTAVREDEEARAQNDEAHARNEAFNEEWQREWYKWICSVRERPDTGEELDQKLAEQKSRA